MSFPLTYRDAMHRLAELTEPGHPASVRHQALTVIVRELSPSNPHHDLVLRALEPTPRPKPIFPEAPPSPGQQTEFHLHPVPADLADPACPGEPPPNDEDNPEEEDDPW